MGLFGTAEGWGMGGWVQGIKAPLAKICHANPTMMKYDTVIPNLKNI